MTMTLEQALATIAQKDRQIEELTRAVEDAQRQITAQQHQLEQLLRRIYGPRSEKLDPDQLVFDDLLIAALEAAAAAGEAPESPAVEVKPHERKKRSHGRVPIPDHLEREDIVIDLPDDEKICPITGRPMKIIGYESSEKLAVEPSRLYVKRFLRPKYVSPDMNEGVSLGVLTPPLPDFPILKCQADTTLLAHVLVSKAVDHLPLYRQEKRFEREEGFGIARSTQDGWYLACAEVLRPLHQQLLVHVKGQPIIGTDDTPVQMLMPGLGKTKQTYMWLYIGQPEPGYHYFDFTVDRRQQRPINVLEGFEGYVQADAASGYDKLFAENESMIEVGCWEHCRRKFHESRNSSPKEASEILGWIAGLYEIENRAKPLSTEERWRTRQQQAGPILDNLFDRLKEMQLDALPKSPLGEAITYALNQEKPLHRYLEDGRLRIGNHLVENLIRPLGIGRKNWLFFGSERGGQAAAVILSLVSSCKALDINPWTYLEDVLRRIMSHPHNRIDELLPANWLPRPGYFAAGRQLIVRSGAPAPDRQLAAACQGPAP